MVRLCLSYNPYYSKVVKIVNVVCNTFCISLPYIAGRKSKQTVQHGKQLSTDIILSRLTMISCIYLNTSGKFIASTQIFLAVN